MKSLDQRFPVYSKLLKLYPHPYQSEYSEQMLQTLADMLDNAETPSQRASIWLRATVDYPLSVVKQQLIFSGGTMNQPMPSYIKQYGVIGGCMMAPFFIFLILNAILGDRLQHSVVWHTNVLLMWLVLLPSLAIILNLAALLHWLQSGRRQTKTSPWRMLTDFQHNWPALSVAIVGLGILAIVFGHDSVGCLTGNPVRELHNFHDTVQCVQQGVPNQNK